MTPLPALSTSPLPAEPGDLRSMWWRDGALHLIDQTRLPHETVVLRCETAEAVAEAIRHLRVRGAPGIGVAAAYGVALGVRGCGLRGRDAVTARLEQVITLLAGTRPTAVNLFAALEHQRRVAHAVPVPEAHQLGERLLAAAHALAEADVAACHQIGAAGLAVIPHGARVLTHCNTGALACVAHGTALGVVRSAHAAGRAVSVWVDETRPVLQGARLTAWELQREGIPATLIVDGAAASLMVRGLVDLVIVGADRIAANGDTANKIGTYALAVLAHAHGVPFYVAAPLTTLDLACPGGEQIVVEERTPVEVTHLAGHAVAPAGMPALNPAFDVTPARLITGIITDHGIARPPYGPALARLASVGVAAPPH